VLARIDLDGNEIPTDEEDALERTRAQIRVREQSLPPQNMFQVVRLAAAAERLSEESVLLPTTQPSSPGVIDENPIPYIRVHINGRGLTATDVSFDQSDSSNTQPPSSYRVNPLPMPLADMVDSYPKPQPRVHDAKTIKVSRVAHLAGR
jgi:hypothetical protein